MNENYTINDVAFHIVNFVIATAIKQNELQISNAPNKENAIKIVDKLFVALHYSGCGGLISAVLNKKHLIKLEDAREIIKNNPQIAFKVLITFIQQYFFV